MLVKIIGENVEVSVFIFQATGQTTGRVRVADTIEGLRIAHRQGLHQDRVDQREDGRVRADSERDRQDHCGSEAWGSAHLPEGGAAGPLYIAAIDTFILSLFLIYLREKTGSLWSSMTLHATKNGVAFMVLYVLHVR